MNSAPLAWMDVVSVDFANSMAFYTNLFGWTRTEIDENGYSFLWAGGQVVAGAEPIAPAKGPARWTVFVQTSDIDGTVGLAEHHGGRITFHPASMAGQGRIAMVEDPAGATIGVWEAGAFDPSATGAVDGRFAGAALSTADPDGVSPFYAACFGWSSLGYDGTTLLVDAAGIPARISPARGAPGWIPVLAVADLGSTLRSAVDAGATLGVARPDHDTDRLVVDPVGATFLVRAAAGHRPTTTPAGWVD